jgi:hypothetical protein
LALAWRNSEPTVRFLSAWILVTFGIFSFYATKLPHYVMPCYPAVFLLLGRALDGAALAGRAARIWDFALRSLIGLAMALLAGAAAAAYRLGPWPMGAVALAGGALLLAGLMAVPRAVLRPTLAKGALAAALLMAGTEGLARGLRAINPTLRALPALAQLPPDAPCGFSGYREPSVVFYTNRRWTTLDEGERLRAFAREPGPRALLVRLREQRLDLKKPRAPNAELQAWFESLAGLGYTLTRVDGWNAARSSRVTLGVAVRKGDSRLSQNLLNISIGAMSDEGICASASCVTSSSFRFSVDAGADRVTGPPSARAATIFAAALSCCENRFGDSLSPYVE